MNRSVIENSSNESQMFKNPFQTFASVQSRTEQKSKLNIKQTLGTGQMANTVGFLQQENKHRSE